MLTSEQLRNDFKYLFTDEVPALKRLVAMLPAHPIVVNIGAGAGTSGLAIMETRPDVTLLTIDIQDFSSPFGCLEAERDVLARSGLNIKGRHFQVCADSVAMGLEWQDGKDLTFNGPIFARERELTSSVRWGRLVDMVFVDGDHSYEHARDDIQTWMVVLKDGGIMAVHDYQKDMFKHSADGPHPKSWPGVDQAVDENLLHKYPLVLHVDSLIAFRKAPL